MKKKVLFVGIERFFMLGLIRCLSVRTLDGMEALSANNPNEIITIAKENPDISMVIFLGRLATERLDDTFRANVGVAIELVKILPKATLIAATDHPDTNRELCKNGCLNTVRRDELRKVIEELL